MTVTRSRTLIFALLTGLSVPAAARAGGSVVWKVGPELRESPTPYAVAMHRGDNFAIAAVERGRYESARRKWQYVRLALIEYDKAIKADPTKAEPHLRAATVLHSHWFGRHIEHCGMRSFRERCLRMVGHWHAFEKKAPLDPRNNDFLFVRALAHTTLATPHHYRQAIRDYIAYKASTRFQMLTPADRATTLGNLAEVYMMLRQLDKALLTYREAIDLAGERLHAYGLAVALDRDGRGSKARELMRNYAQGDRNADGKLRSISRDGVFFVPKGEIHYYYALGYEANGHLAKAILAYQQFIDSGAHPPFHRRARENIVRLRKELVKRLKSKPAPTFITPVLPGQDP